MGISILIGIVCTLAGGGSFLYICTDEYGGKFIPTILLLASVFGLYACNTSPKLIKDRQLSQEEDAREKANCQKSKLVSEINGVQLYSYSRGCNDSHPVYFSKSGTQKTECKRVGKHMVCEDIAVPNQ